MRNSELSYLTRTLQDKNKILEEELHETVGSNVLNIQLCIDFVCLVSSA